jgi:hypothetical protein
LTDASWRLYTKKRGKFLAGLPLFLYFFKERNVNHPPKFKTVGNSTIVNEKTGEIYSKENVNFSIREAIKCKIREDFMLTFQDSLEEVAENKGLTAGACRVLFYFLSKMNYENCVFLTQGEIAESLGTTRQQIGKSIAVLIKNNYVKTFVERGSVNTYMISPKISIRGDEKTRKDITRFWNNLK